MAEKKAAEFNSPKFQQYTYIAENTRDVTDFLPLFVIDCMTIDNLFFSLGNLSFMINNKRSAETNILFIFNLKLDVYDIMLRLFFTIFS